MDQDHPPHETGFPRLMGEANVTRDERGRIVIPGEHYYAFEDAGEAVVGPAPNGESLYVFPPQAWAKLVDRLRQAKEQGDPEATAFMRLYTSLYRREKVQGKSRRIDVTSDLAQLAGLGQSVFVVGRDDRLQVFSEAAWRKLQSDILTHVKPMAEQSRWD